MCGRRKIKTIIKFARRVSRRLRCSFNGRAVRYSFNERNAHRMGHASPQPEPSQDKNVFNRHSPDDRFSQPEVAPMTRLWQDGYVVETQPRLGDASRGGPHYAVDITGGGRSSAISRRTWAKRVLGMATSASGFRNAPSGSPRLHSHEPPCRRRSIASLDHAEAARRH
jgi:hypothetical protein